MFQLCFKRKNSKKVSCIFKQQIKSYKILLIIVKKFLFIAEKAKGSDYIASCSGESPESFALSARSSSLLSYGYQPTAERYVAANQGNDLVFKNSGQPRFTLE